MRFLGFFISLFVFNLSGALVAAHAASNECEGILSSNIPYVVGKDPFFSRKDLTQWRQFFSEMAGRSLLLEKFTSVGRILAQVYFEVRVENGKVSKLEFKDGYESFFPLPLMRSTVIEVIEELLARFPESHGFFEQSRRYGVLVFLRYNLSAGEKNPGVTWHQDDVNYQFLVPLKIPSKLRGGRLFFRKRPDREKSQKPMVAVLPRTNRYTAFIGRKTWHAVEDFISEQEGARDILGLGFSDRIDLLPTDKRPSQVEGFK